MDVYFRFTQGEKRNAHKVGNHRIVASGGIYKTSDKETITDILACELYKRDQIVMLGDQEAIEKYLLGDEPDYLTKELLYKLPDDAILELGQVCGTKNRKMPMIIRAELQNVPISDAVAAVIEDYTLNDNVIEDVLEKAKEDGLLTINKRWFKFDPEKIGVKATLDKAEAQQILYDYYRSL